MTNPFLTLKQMAAKRDSLRESIRELQEFVENLANAVEASGLAPDTAAQLKSFHKEGLVIIRDLFSEEARHAIKEQSAITTAADIIQTAQRKDSEE